MSLHVQRIFSKLPKYFACTDGFYLKGCSKLSFLQGDKRACSFLAPVCSKDFRFPNAVFRPLICVHSNPLLETKHGVTVCQRYNSTDKESKDKSLVQARENPYAHLTVGQKVKEVGKDATYTVVIIAGIAVTGLMFYMIGRELLSSESPSGVYGDALKKCQNSIEVTAALGEPIKGYGETTRRGRRRHVSHTEFEVRGIPHMRMRFYIEGPYKKATVHVEVQKGDSGKYEYRYLVVETEGYPQRTFVLEDAR